MVVYQLSELQLPDDVIFFSIELDLMVEYPLSELQLADDVIFFFKIDVIVVHPLSEL